VVTLPVMSSSGRSLLKGVGPKTAEIFLREVPDALIGAS
jgi:hypothetical protein